ncbi:hypothetical protein GCM10010124_41040 [Pilimelia terevasa]|uniref:M23ase beta-sheet core domain-containing protein n=1 Tax=Pilimelia terevasa TaxID=53372 RepID=A0A8J3BR80_9ACTN|nr:M23 family metallopeptidase [Pilimelia terevasa]GGK43966.1 hypothetical protein GCM10010124_41040 [Pilimelia terevasa]
MPVHRTLAAAAGAAALALSLAAAGGCRARPAAGPGPSPAAPAPSSPAPGAPAAAAARTPAGGGAAAYRYVFPVGGRATYARTHHDYPAADIMAPCGAAALSPVDGTVLEVSRVDRYRPSVDDGATRGGLSVAIRGADGVRYYGSHYRRVDAAVVAGRPVRAGQRIADVGDTGLAGACHVHFGLSPACAGTGDWWVRRGVLWPAGYLDAWRRGEPRSPAAAVRAWQSAHGCPARPRDLPATPPAGR